MTLLNSGVTGSILIKFTNYVVSSSPSNLLTSELQYSNQFQNAEATNKGESADFAHFDLKIRCRGNVP